MTSTDPVAVTTTAAVVTNGSVILSANGAPGVTDPAAMVTQSQNGSIPHSNQQKPPSVTGTIKPPSLVQGSVQQQGSLTQGQKPPSLSQGQKLPSLQGSKQGSFIHQQQHQQPFQPTLATLPQLPEPLIPMSGAIDSKQEIVENYLNSLPPVTNGGLNGINGGR